MIRTRVKFLIVAVFLFICLFYLTNDKQLNVPTQEDVQFTVLFQTDSVWVYKPDVGPSFLRSLGCPVQNCLITRNSAMKSIEKFDMVMFLAENNFVHQFKLVEPHRTPEQIYGLLLLEPPHIVGDLKGLDQKINWTIGYRSDTDIKYMYGSLIDKRTNEVAPRNFTWQGFDPNTNSSYVLESNIPRIVKSKRKLVAWFVSNCDRVQSQRMELAQALSQHIPVDIYGKCGTLSCTRGSDSCYDMLEADYKFYLSFENALCRDYMTEKVFKIMSRTVVPVIYSGANISNILPPKSYINVEDYETVADLATHLIYLDTHPAEYQKYFWWKEFYKLGKTHYACHLCERLNERNATVPIDTYHSLDEWYRKDVCRSPRVLF